jgi:hypothetical protein
MYAKQVRFRCGACGRLPTGELVLREFLDMPDGSCCNVLLRRERLLCVSTAGSSWRSCSMRHRAPRSALCTLCPAVLALATRSLPFSQGVAWWQWGCPTPWWQWGCPPPWWQWGCPPPWWQWGCPPPWWQCEALISVLRNAPQRTALPGLTLLLLL